MIKIILRNFTVTNFNNGNCHIRVNKNSIEFLKNLDNEKLKKEVNKLIDGCDLFLNVINGYHYLMNFNNSIAYDIHFIDNFLMEIEDLIKGKEKLLILENLPKKDIKSLNQDLSNGF